MELSRSVDTKLEHYCKGLVCHGNRLYVTDGQAVYLYSTEGKPQGLLYKIPPYVENKLEWSSGSIEVSEDGSKLYILKSRTLVTLDISGKHLYTLTDQEIYDSQTVDSKGSVLVTSLSGSILQICADGEHKLGTIVHNSLGTEKPRAILFDRKKSVILLGSWSDYLVVLKLI